MARIIPSEYSNVDTVDLRTRAFVRASSFSQVAEAQNYLYARSGALLGGAVFEPEFSISSPGSSYAQTPDSSAYSRSLKAFNPEFFLKSPIRSGQKAVHIQAFAAGCTLKVELEEQSGDSVATTMDFSPAGNWDEAYYVIPSNLNTSDPLKASAYVKSNTGQTGIRVKQIQIHEAIITETQLP